jgi:F-type H+-transporting ATPase subunit delta
METAFRRAYQPAEGALEEVLAHDGGAVDAARLGDELWQVAHVVDANPTLRRNLADPSREGADKAVLAERLLAGKVGAGTMHVVKAVAAQRWKSGGDLVSALERLGVESVLTHAQRSNRLGQVEDELFRFSRIVASTPDLQAALSDRQSPGPSRAALVDRLLSVKTAPETVRLAKQAVSGVRGRRFDRSLESYLEQAAAKQDQVTATVTTAVPLSAGQLDRLVGILSQQYGRSVHANVVLDENVVGGIRVEIGDEVLDGTVSHRLAEARRLMTT